MLDEDATWIGRALCRRDPDAWHPHARDQAAIDAAIAECQRCPVIDDCAEHRVRVGATHGVWAGEFLNDRNYVSPVERFPCGTERAYKRHVRLKERCVRCERMQLLRRVDSNAVRGATQRGHWIR